MAVELQLVQQGPSFGQLRNRQCEHGLDESDLNFRDTHILSIAAEMAGPYNRCYRMAERRLVSTQPKSSPSGVIDIDLAWQFRAL